MRYKRNRNLPALNRHIYQDYQLTIALHPSETIEHMVARILAFAPHAANVIGLSPFKP